MNSKFLPMTFLLVHSSFLQFSSSDLQYVLCVSYLVVGSFSVCHLPPLYGSASYKYKICKGKHIYKTSYLVSFGLWMKNKIFALLHWFKIFMSYSSGKWDQLARTKSKSSLLACLPAILAYWMTGNCGMVNNHMPIAVMLLPSSFVYSILIVFLRISSFHFI